MSTPSDKQTDNQPALQPPERIRILIREGRFANEWYYPDAAVMPYEAEFAYARVVDGGVATVDAERQAAAIVTIWRAVKDHDDKLLVHYIKQALLEWCPVAATAPAAPTDHDSCSHWREGDTDHCVWCGDDLGPTTEADVAAPQDEQPLEFRTTKEAMLYAHRNNIPAVIPLASPQTAMRAAEEIRDWLGITGLVDGNGIKEVAAIIQRHYEPETPSKAEKQ